MLMRKSATLLIAVCVVALVSLTAAADVLDFEPATTGVSTPDLVLMPAGYGGFTWDNWSLRNGSDPGIAGTGYDTGRVSGDYTAYNMWGDVATMSVASPDSFDFNGAYFTAAWSDGLTIQVEGYSNAVLVGSASLVVDTTGPTWWAVNLVGVDNLVFSASGGADPTRSHFAMDNFTFNQDPVPEPASMTLMALGLAGMAARRLRKK